MNPRNEESGAEAPGRLTHVDQSGRPQMVDVGSKAATDRTASAAGHLVMQPETLELLMEGRTPKGDPLVVARIAGIQAAKRAADLIPMCHPIALTSIDIDLHADSGLPGIEATATVSAFDRTGVEMEALVAVSVALLTAYDMLKAVDRSMRIEGIRLLRKTGGRSGEWVRDPT